MDIAEKVKNRPESFVVDETGKPTSVSLPQMQVYDFNKKLDRYSKFIRSKAFKELLTEEE